MLRQAVSLLFGLSLVVLINAGEASAQSIITMSLGRWRGTPLTHWLTLRHMLKYLLGLTLLLAPNLALAQLTTTIGEMAVLTAGDSGNGGYVLAQKTTLTQAATIKSLSFYVTNAAGKLRLGIYDDFGASENPGKLVAATNVFVPTVGWNTQNVVTPVALAPGNYWLAYSPTSNNLGFVKQNNSGYCVYYIHSGALATTFSKALDICTPTTWSFYATLITTGLVQATGVNCTETQTAFITPVSPGTVIANCSVSPSNWAGTLTPGGANASLFATKGDELIVGPSGISAQAVYEVNVTASP